MANVITHARYGQMIYDPDDFWLGRSFRLYGEFSECETDVFKSAIKPGDVVVDAGANIGAHTLLFAKLAESVLAFEPQRLIFQTLCGNLAINNVTNVYAFQVGLSNGAGNMFLTVPQDNCGGGALVDHGTEGEPVDVRALDDYRLTRVDFIKADVEGHEAKLLAGAADTIKRCRPLLYLENDRGDKQALIDQVKALDYDLWWHKPPLFNPDNYAGNPINVFVFPTKEPNNYGIIVSDNMLCAPKERNFQAEIDTWSDAEHYESIKG